MQVLDLEILVLKLHASNLGGDRLIILFLQVFELKWVVDGVTTVGRSQSVASLQLTCIELILEDFFVLAATAATELL